MESHFIFKCVMKLCYYYLININIHAHQFYEKYACDPYTVLGKYYKTPATPELIT